MAITLFHGGDLEGVAIKKFVFHGLSRAEILAEKKKSGVLAEAEVVQVPQGRLLAGFCCCWGFFVVVGGCIWFDEVDRSGLLSYAVPSKLVTLGCPRRAAVVKGRGLRY